jgi:hypothetical protein
VVSTIIASDQAIPPQFINADKVFGTQDKLLRFLRQEEGVDVYLNLLTGKGGYMGRT